MLSKWSAYYNKKPCNKQVKTKIIHQQSEVTAQITFYLILVYFTNTHIALPATYINAQCPICILQLANNYND